MFVRIKAAEEQRENGQNGSRVLLLKDHLQFPKWSTVAGNHSTKAA